MIMRYEGETTKLSECINTKPQLLSKLRNKKERMQKYSLVAWINSRLTPSNWIAL